MKFEMVERIEGVVVRRLSRFEDGRGWLSEIFRSDELDHGVAMCYVSWTHPDVGRGPHEHVYQSDCFAFVGPGSFRVYLWDTRQESSTYLKQMRFEAGSANPMTVYVPPGVVHAYKCVSEEVGLVINLPDRLYKGLQKKEDVDEIRHEDLKDSPFVLD